MLGQHVEPIGGPLQGLDEGGPTAALVLRSKAVTMRGSRKASAVATCVSASVTSCASVEPACARIAGRLLPHGCGLTPCPAATSARRRTRVERGPHQHERVHALRIAAPGVPSRQWRFAPGLRPAARSDARRRGASLAHARPRPGSPAGCAARPPSGQASSPPGRPAPRSATGAVWAPPSPLATNACTSSSLQTLIMTSRSTAASASEPASAPPRRCFGGQGLEPGAHAGHDQVRPPGMMRRRPDAGAPERIVSGREERSHVRLLQINGSTAMPWHLVERDERRAALAGTTPMPAR